MQNLIELKARYDGYLRDAFRDHAQFKRTIQTDFEYFVNEHKRAAEFLSLYIDDVLKNASKKMNEENAEQLLDKTIILFRLLQEKDVFERWVYIL